MTASPLRKGALFPWSRKVPWLVPDDNPFAVDYHSNLPVGSIELGVGRRIADQILIGQLAPDVVKCVRQRDHLVGSVNAGFCTQPFVLVHGHRICRGRGSRSGSLPPASSARGRKPRHPFPRQVFQDTCRRDWHIRRAYFQSCRSTVSARCAIEIASSRVCLLSTSSPSLINTRTRRFCSRGPAFFISCFARVVDRVVHSLAATRLQFLDFLVKASGLSVKSWMSELLASKV